MDVDGEGKKSSFEEFLLVEYSNIATAHFNVKAQISNFFRYYLLLIALPVPVLAVLKSLSSTPTADNIFKDMFGEAASSAAGLCVCLGIVGFFVMLYIVKLNITSILYARTVNGIRHYFYSSYDGDLSPIKVLPDDIKRPKFSKFHSVYLICVPFSLIDAFYIQIYFDISKNLSIHVLLTYFLSFVVHILFSALMFMHAECAQRT